MNIMNIISLVILAFSITLLANAFQLDLGVPVIKGLTSCLFAIEARRFEINPPYFFIVASCYSCFHANASDTRKICFLLSSQFFYFGKFLFFPDKFVFIFRRLGGTSRAENALLRLFFCVAKQLQSCVIKRQCQASHLDNGWTTHKANHLLILKML